MFCLRSLRDNTSALMLSQSEAGSPASVYATHTQVYLIIKDVCPGEDEVIIITSSLMKAIHLLIPWLLFM